MARPTKYKEEYTGIVEKLSAMGATNTDIAEALSVAVSTVHKWRDENKAFSDAIKRGKAEADNHVEKSLYERAMGYSHPEEKIFNNGGEALRVETTKHYPPDATAIIFWLKNRKPQEWREKSEIDHHIKTINVNTNVDYGDE